jgi:hypothetical protein
VTTVAHALSDLAQTRESRFRPVRRKPGLQATALERGLHLAFGYFSASESSAFRFHPLALLHLSSFIIHPSAFAPVWLRGGFDVALMWLVRFFILHLSSFILPPPRGFGRLELILSPHFCFLLSTFCFRLVVLLHSSFFILPSPMCPNSRHLRFAG